MIDSFSAFQTTAAPARAAPFRRPPDAPYPDAGLARLLARSPSPEPVRSPVADAGSIEEREALASVAVHYAGMSEAAASLDHLAGKVARLELALADPALTEAYPDDSDERDAGEERLRRLRWGWGEALNLFSSHAAQIDRLLDGVPYETAVAEVRGWAAAWRDGDAVFGVARGNANVMSRRWICTAVGLACRVGKGEPCPY